MNGIRNTQWKIRQAIQSLHKKYHKNPWIFMTEADIQCTIFSEIIKKISKSRKTLIKGFNEKKIKDWKYQVLTKALHSELSSSRRKATEFVDLCLVIPSKFEFYITKTKFDRGKKEMPISGWKWNPEDSIGIEIKFNKWVQKKFTYSRKTKRFRITEKWKYYEKSLKNDLKKLVRYKRGWLILVDQHSLIKTYKEWRSFIDVIIRKANYGKAKKTLNAYYLCPKRKKALSYKSSRNSI
jgi:hypothetical protein